MDLVDIYRADKISRFVEARQNELRRQHRELRRIDRLERALNRARTRLSATPAPSWSFHRSAGAR